MWQLSRKNLSRRKKFFQKNFHQNLKKNQLHAYKAQGPTKTRTPNLRLKEKEPGNCEGLIINQFEKVKEKLFTGGIVSDYKTLAFTSVEINR